MYETKVLNKEKVIEAYVKAALWTTTDDNEEPLDDLYTINDMSEEALTEAKNDVEGFLCLTEDIILEWLEDNSKDNVEEEVGIDFWLTRNGHGAGFWEGDWGSVGDALTAHSKSFGTCDYYLGDDEEIYSFSG